MKLTNAYTNTLESVFGYNYYRNDNNTIIIKLPGSPCRYTNPPSTRWRKTADALAKGVGPEAATGGRAKCDTSMMCMDTRAMYTSWLLNDKATSLFVPSPRRIERQPAAARTTNTTNSPSGDVRGRKYAETTKTRLCSNNVPVDKF